MDSIHHYSVIAIKFTVSPIFPYLGCAAFLQLSIIYQEKKISPSKGSYVVYLGQTSGRTTLCFTVGIHVKTDLMHNDPQCTH